MRDLSGEVTVFVTTIGDEDNFRDCLSHLEGQTVKFRIDVIDHVAPLSAALQQMLDRCATPYYVQVDEDMLLSPDAVERLYEAMVAAPPEVAIVCGALWDCDVTRPIYGVKVYRHCLVWQFPYEDTFSCEKTQAQRMREANLSVCLMPRDSREVCLGEHGKHYTPRTLFHRWRRLLHKQRRYGTLDWVEPWPALLAERYVRTREPLHLYAFLGAVAGILGDLPPDREADFRRESPDFTRLAKYFPTE